MKKRVFYIFLFVYTYSFAQNYAPIDTTDYLKRSELVKKYNEDFKLFKKSFKKLYKGDIRKEVEKSYTFLNTDFVKNIEKKRLVFNPIFSDYIQNLTNNIIKNNSDLSSDKLTIYVSRHNSPNAVSMGNGVILLNMGLFKYLENEAQLVSVITHEIAHLKLKHAENNIIYKAKLNTSKEKKQQSKEIKKQKFNQYDKAFEIMKDLLYTDSKRYRKQESEADSLGYVFFKKTKYPKIEFINALGILAKLDSLPEIQLKKETYKKVFHLPKQPFNEKWLTMEDFTSYNYDNYKDKIDKDSVKSHPEIIERIQKLKKIFSDIENNTSTTDNNKFLELQNIARKEDVANLNYLEKYGLSIYLTLYRLEKFPDNNYYKSWLGKNFDKLYEAKKKYQFNRYVDRLVPNEQDKSYQQFLSFLWNLNLNEIKNIADFYTKK
ncbi:M48 family metallopeptidase [Tenacibaculum sp. 47A_GOM-205m]|uniref:M48 family metallopeptidase n=1 Tax=Tenacibaculum sp. 47A_GOM-205m TaxID=1380384 RepID=UPI00048F7C0A|nr:M48 family metallopeptidase [Tenacibaculum sp. 47A_GOM-205m]